MRKINEKMIEQAALNIGRYDNIHDCRSELIKSAESYDNFFKDIIHELDFSKCRKTHVMLIKKVHEDWLLKRNMK
jgi:hypothetical protein